MTASRPYAEVIGDPIDHSLSPAIHNFWLETLEIAADYGRRQVRRGQLADYLAERRADPQWRGCNVTMPLKLDALTLADGASDRARLREKRGEEADMPARRIGRAAGPAIRLAGGLRRFERREKGGAVRRREPRRHAREVPLPSIEPCARRGGAG